jgi:hypothetical protein
MALSDKKERFKLFNIHDNFSKRIPVVKLERVETLYPTFQTAAHKSVVSNNDKEHKSSCA